MPPKKKPNAKPLSGAALVQAAAGCGSWESTERLELVLDACDEGASLLALSYRDVLPR